MLQPRRADLRKLLDHASIASGLVAAAAGAGGASTLTVISITALSEMLQRIPATPDEHADFSVFDSACLVGAVALALEEYSLRHRHDQFDYVFSRAELRSLLSDLELSRWSRESMSISSRSNEMEDLVPEVYSRLRRHLIESHDLDLEDPGSGGFEDDPSLAATRAERVMRLVEQAIAPHLPVVVVAIEKELDTVFSRLTNAPTGQQRSGIGLKPLRRGPSAEADPRDWVTAMSGAASAHLRQPLLPTFGLGKDDVEVRFPTLGDGFLDPDFIDRGAVGGADRWRERSGAELGPWLDSHLRSREGVRWPTLLTGQPGSGKSSLGRLLAARLNSLGNSPTFFVSLRSYVDGRSLDEWVRAEVHKQTGGVGLEGLAPEAQHVVLIADGLDEFLVAERFSESSRSVVDRLQEFALSVEGPPMSLLITCREAVVDLTVLPTGTRRVQIEPFDEAHVDDWCTIWNELNGVNLVPADLEIDAKVVGQPLLLSLLSLYLTIDGGGSPALRNASSPFEAYSVLVDFFLRRDAAKALPELHRSEEEWVEFSARRRQALRLLALAILSSRDYAVRMDSVIDIFKVVEPAKTPGISEVGDVLSSFFLVATSGGLPLALERVSVEFLHRSFYEFFLIDLLVTQFIPLIERALSAGDAVNLPWGSLSSLLGVADIASEVGQNVGYWSQVRGALDVSRFSHEFASVLSVFSATQAAMQAQDEAVLTTAGRACISENFLLLIGLQAPDGVSRVQLSDVDAAATGHMVWSPKQLVAERFATVTESAAKRLLELGRLVTAEDALWMLFHSSVGARAMDDLMEHLDEDAELRSILLWGLPDLEHAAIRKYLSQPNAPDWVFGGSPYAASFTDREGEGELFKRLFRASEYGSTVLAELQVYLLAMSEGGVMPDGRKYRVRALIAAAASTVLFNDGSGGSAASAARIAERLLAISELEPDAEIAQTLMHAAGRLLEVVSDSGG